MSKPLKQLVGEVRLTVKDAREFIFRVPKTKYQAIDKITVIVLIIAPLVLALMLVIFRG